MDELELSGRRHISTKRAGKEHGYHSDYIGQLIRGKKVAGQKVGRSWYVDAESLGEYLGKNPAPHSAPEVLLETQQEPSSSGDMNTTPTPPAQTPVVFAQELVEEKAVKPVVVQHVTPEEKVEIKKPLPVMVAVPKPEEKKEERFIPIHTGGLTYLPDDEPLLPVVRTRARDEESVAPHIEDVSAPTPTPRRGRKVWRAALLVLLALVVVGVSAIGSVLVTTTTVVVEGKTASTYYSLWQK